MQLKIVMCSLLSMCAYAGTIGEIREVKPFPYVATFSIGPVWTSPGRTQTLYLIPQVEKTYTASSSTQTIADGELFLGIQKSFAYDLCAHLGIAGALTSSVNVSGNIWDDADPIFDNYSYNYRLQHGHIALKAKVFKDTPYNLGPWVSGSIGVGFNRAYGFTNTGLIPEVIIQNNFGNNTQTSFTYTVGVGVQKSIAEHLQAGLGYEFANWGQSRLNRASGQTIGQGLSLSHVYTNGLMFNLTYIAY